AEGYEHSKPDMNAGGQGSAATRRIGTQSLTYSLTFFSTFTSSFSLSFHFEDAKHSSQLGIGTGGSMIEWVPVIK
ncbi:hypothetical protein HGM15179_011069, partial [Zosterops borbonicus]